MGKAYTIRAHAFGMNVQFYDPYRPQGEDKSMGVTQCETLVRILTLPLPLVLRRAHLCPLSCVPSVRRSPSRART